MKVTQKQYLNPAEYLIHVFGNANRAAKALKRTRQSIYKWRDSEGGKITHLAFEKILLVAFVQKLDIAYDDLVNGRMVEK